MFELVERGHPPPPPLQSFRALQGGGGGGGAYLDGDRPFGAGGGGLVARPPPAPAERGDDFLGGGREAGVGKGMGGAYFPRFRRYAERAKNGKAGIRTGVLHDFAVLAEVEADLFLLGDTRSG